MWGGGGGWGVGGVPVAGNTNIHMSGLKSVMQHVELLPAKKSKVTMLRVEIPIVIALGVIETMIAYAIFQVAVIVTVPK